MRSLAREVLSPQTVQHGSSRSNIAAAVPALFLLCLISSLRCVTRAGAALLMRPGRETRPMRSMLLLYGMVTCPCCTPRARTSPHIPCFKNSVQVHEWCTTPAGERRGWMMLGCARTGYYDGGVSPGRYAMYPGCYAYEAIRGCCEASAMKLLNVRKCLKNMIKCGVSHGISI